MRRCFLYTALFLGLALVLGTELLSAFHALHRAGVMLYWGVVLTGALLILIFTGTAARVFALSTIRARAFAQFIAASPGRIATVLALSAFVIALGIVAWYAPPNTYDSMTYHMARVAHWQQNASVEFYPTAISRQYEYPPFAEYAILHLQILLGDDRLANFVQFGAYFGCMVVASLIAQAMGLTGDGQLLAGVIVASLPMAVNEATGTQTDLVASFWLGSAVYWILVAQKFSLARSTLLVGASLVLTAFVKFPAALIGAPFFVWYLVRVGRARPARKTFAAVLLGCVALFLLIQGPYLMRRAELGMNALAARETLSHGGVANELPLRYINHRMDGAAFFSTAARHLGLHLSLPNAEWNAAMTTLLRGFHRVIGIPPDDNATTYPARMWQRVKFVMHEDETGSFLHLLLVTGAAVWALSGRNAARARWHEYIGALTASAVLFVLVLKWSMWNSRYHTLLFVLAAPLVAAWLVHVFGAKRVWLPSLGLLIAALPWLFWSQPRPLLGETSVLRVRRETQYFANAQHLELPMQNAVAYIQARDCRNIGLWWGGNDWEYPWFALLRARNYDARIEQVYVNNASQILWNARASFQPCVIVAHSGSENQVEWNNTRYVLRAEWAPLRIYEPQP